jgi:hypothetical protein
MSSPLGWFSRLLSRGEATPRSDDTIVEAGYMGLVEGQMVLVRLHEAGLHATSAVAAPTPYQSTTMSRIFCRSGDLGAVQRIIEEVTNQR